MSPEMAADAAQDMGTVHTALDEALHLIAAHDHTLAALNRSDGDPYSALRTLVSQGIEAAERVQRALRAASA